MRWFWRTVDARGALIRESTQRFASSVEAFEDAKRNGFDRETHEWYLAKSGSQPCSKITRSA